MGKSKKAVERRVEPMVRLLPITNCYQCYRRDYMNCICIDTGKKHPTSDKKIPKWCPLPNNRI